MNRLGSDSCLDVLSAERHLSVTLTEKTLVDFENVRLTCAPPRSPSISVRMHKEASYLRIEKK